MSPTDRATLCAEILTQAQAQGCDTIERFLLEKICWLLDERESPPKRCLFVANDAQREFLDAMWYWNEILKARQQGFSALLALLVFVFCLTKPDFRAGIIDRTDQEAKKKLARIKYAYDNLHLTPLGAMFKADLPLISPSNDHTLTFANGSQIYAATSLRGGTLSFLWISELGTIALKDPGKAEEIMGGSLEAVHPGNIVVSESTHEGGRYGEHYRLIRLAQKSPPAEYRSNMQWAFHFFGWWKNPRYAVALPPGRPLALTPELSDYFAKLEAEAGITVSDEQKNWYAQKSATQRDMARQYPGTPEEALRATSEGAIYADLINRLRAQGRVCDLVMEPGSQLLTSWDLGESDATGVWLVQVVGPDKHALDFHCANGMTPAEHAAKMLQWEREWKKPIAAHYLPHDAHQRKAGSSWLIELKKAGLTNLVLVPRIPDVWVGINQTREVLPTFRFNARTCEREFPQPGDRVWPSGLAALEGYRKKVEAVSGAEKPIPVHDECESGASALRTFCEALKGGRLVGPSRMEQDSRRESQGPQRAKMGISRPGYEPKRPLQRALMR